MCGLSSYDVFSLGLLDPPPGIKEEDCSLTATLADPQLSHSSTAAPQQQPTGTGRPSLPHGEPADAGQRHQHKMEPQVSSLRDQLRQFQYPPLMGEVWSQAPVCNNSSLSVFVPVSYAGHVQVSLSALPLHHFAASPAPDPARSKRGWPW